MPFIEVNGARLFYQTYGEDHPGQAPIVLIHGSTNTGAAEWSSVAPLLARKWKVIVPDCRGHGQSSNPQMTYSFRELAADVAALVRQLGYPRAHILGHSNGGNVALVTLLEHPDIVQTAVIQAGNAYVSQDLIEIEPNKFDPERVQREVPQWMDEMIRLHGPTHGPEYWRDLLRMTVKEIVSAPNYTPQQLKRVERPVLVIEGALDTVNAVAQHAQWMAQHIPLAELWQPAGVAHNVHLEAPLEWLRRVEDFLERRGSPVGEALYRLQQSRYADERQGMFDVRVASGADGVHLQGHVLNEDMRQAAMAQAGQAAGSAPVDASGLQALLTDASPSALVNRTVTDMRREPRMLSERISQALLGEAARVLSLGEEWSLVRLDHDGYIGWVQTAALHICSAQESAAYRQACAYKVQAELLAAYQSAGDGCCTDQHAGKIPFGVNLAVVDTQAGQAQVQLPDGRRWWVSAKGLLAYAECPRQSNPADVKDALRLIRRFMGVPYLWGGRTPFGYDCSGLAGAFYAFLGITIPRDADQQYRAGLPVAGAAQPGDLLYFGEKRASQRIQGITHVAISLGDTEFIHSTGAVWGITCNSLDPQSPIYRAWLRDNLVGIRRFSL